jgi:hypothetical protein
MLKKEYGGPITVYNLGTTSTNYDSGVKTHTRDSVFIRRAIVLPVRIAREIVQSISMISANKKIVQGGTFDTGKRTFIIDRTDVPSTFRIDNDDWIVYDNKRYDVITADEFEQKTAWLVVAKEIEGVTPEQDLPAVGNSYLLSLTQSASATIV